MSPALRPFFFSSLRSGLEPGRKHDEYDAQLRQYVERGAAADGDEFSAGQRLPHGGAQEKTRHQRADDLRQAYAAEQQPQQLGAEQYECKIEQNTVIHNRPFLSSVTNAFFRYKSIRSFWQKASSRVYIFVKKSIMPGMKRYFPLLIGLCLLLAGLTVRDTFADLSYDTLTVYDGGETVYEADERPPSTRGKYVRADLEGDAADVLKTLGARELAREEIGRHDRHIRLFAEHIRLRDAALRPRQRDDRRPRRPPRRRQSAHKRLVLTSAPGRATPPRRTCKGEY